MRLANRLAFDQPRGFDRARGDSGRAPSAAFSLIELIIVFLIAGIFMTIALPRITGYPNYSDRARTRHQLSVLRDAIDLARARDGRYPPSGQLVAIVGPMLSGPFPVPTIVTGSDTSCDDATNEGLIYYDNSEQITTPVTTRPAAPAVWAYKPSNGQLRLNVGRRERGYDW